jgi:hypothetical protein
VRRVIHPRVCVFFQDLVFLRSQLFLLKVFRCLFAHPTKDVLHVDPRHNSHIRTAFLCLSNSAKISFVDSLLYADVLPILVLHLPVLLDLEETGVELVI